MMTTPETFLLEEFKAMRAEILELRRDIKQTETVAGGVVLGTLAWLATNHVPLGLIWFIPVVVPAIGAKRSSRLASSIRAMGAYIEVIEARLLSAGSDTSGLGWEHHLARTRKDPGPGRRSEFWTLFLLLSLLGPLLLNWQQLLQWARF